MSNPNSTGLFVCDAFGHYRPAPPEEVIAIARAALSAQFQRGQALNSPNAVRVALCFHLAPYEREVFAVLFLDSQHHVLAFEELFFGTISHADVYPRVLVQQALRHNAHAVVFCHNHPSGAAKPSDADRAVTTKLQAALALVDIVVLDHFIVGGSESYSFAEHGLI